MHTGALFLTSQQQQPIRVCRLLHAYRITIFLTTFFLTLLSIIVSNVTWRDVTGYDVIWKDLTWFDMTWKDTKWHKRIWRDITRRELTRHDMKGCEVTWNKNMLVCICRLVSLCINLLSCTRCSWLKPVVFTGESWHQMVTLATSSGPPSVWWTDGCSCTRWSLSSVGVQVCFFILMKMMSQNLRVQKFLMWWIMEELTGFESESLFLCWFLSGGSGISSGGEALSRSGWGWGCPLHITGQSAAELWACSCLSPFASFCGLLSHLFRLQVQILAL